MERKIIAVSYKDKKIHDGLIYLPFKYYELDKKKADILREQGFTNIKVLEVNEKVLYIPEIGEI